MKPYMYRMESLIVHQVIGDVQKFECILFIAFSRPVQNS